MTEWKTEKLSNLLTVSIGGIWGVEAGEAEVDVAVVRVTELKAHGRIDPSSAVTRSVTLKQLASRELQEGDLLLEKSGGGPNSPVGRVGYFSQESTRTVCSNFMQLMRPDSSKVLPKYLFHFLGGFYSNGGTIPMQTATTNIRNIKTPQYIDIDVSVPPIDEQHKILELLEYHLSRLDAALADVHLAKLKAFQFRRSLLKSLMSTEDAGSSSDWTRTTLGSVCDLVAGKTPPSLERSIDGIDDSSRSVPFYKVGDMNLDPEFLCKSRLYLSVKQVEERKLFILPIGSVVFPKTGGAIATNKKRVVSIPGPIDLNCMAAIPRQGTNPKYLSWWFQSINLSTYADGSILPQLSKGKMSEIPVDWPNQNLQEEIVMSLEQSLSKNSEAIKLAEAIEANASSLRRSLLQSAFSGKLLKEVANV